MRSIIALAALLLVVPGLVAAQANPDSVKHRNNCRLAEQVLATGQPGPKRAWAIPYLSGCGAAGGAALATAIDHERASTDVKSLERLYLTPAVLVDRAIFQEVLGVAGDGAASVPARILSFGTLLMYESPSYYTSYDELVGASSPDAGCRLISRPPHPVLVGTPLPADYLAQSRALAQRVAADESEPRSLRNAASCVVEGIARLGP
ncbi:MAG TPA: hypothetical protein VFW98_12320 [Gemmatimonadaceae bacterium]|nr:hypothetical protein [Gemmatimonadaceae bacterium]